MASPFTPVPPARPARPFSAPGSGGSNSSASPSRPLPFVHRDIFAPPPSPRQQRAAAEAEAEEEGEPQEGKEGAAAAASGADGFSTPPPRRRRTASMLPLIPSAAKLERWNTKLGQYPLLGWLESHTGIRKVYIASALLFLTALLVFRGTGLGLVSVSVGFLYPLHMSLKTIENCRCLFEEISGENRARHTEQQIAEKRGEIIGQLRKWLVYWVVYGLFTTLESLSDTALSWLPVYHPLKLAFLLWCFLPRFQGSQLVFDILVRPVLIRHEAAIEDTVDTAHQAAVAGVGRAARAVRAKSIQLSQAISFSGSQAINLLASGASSSAGSSAPAASSSSSAPSSASSSQSSTVVSPGGTVRERVASIETGVFGRTVPALSRIHEEEYFSSPSRRVSGAAQQFEGEGQQQEAVAQALRAASKVAAAAQKP